jgi:hypothetical protein
VVGAREIGWIGSRSGSGPNLSNGQPAPTGQSRTHVRAAVTDRQEPRNAPDYRGAGNARGTRATSGRLHRAAPRFCEAAGGQQPQLRQRHKPKTPVAVARRVSPYFGLPETGPVSPQPLHSRRHRLRRHPMAPARRRLWLAPGDDLQRSQPNRSQRKSAPSPKDFPPAGVSVIRCRQSRNTGATVLRLEAAIH